MSDFWAGFEKQAKVFAYRNIRKGGGEHVYSVREDGKVKKHTSGLLIAPATFKVSAAGRDRVRAEGVKNVHAGVFGDEAEVDHSKFDWRPVTYDPKKHNGFVDRETGAPVAKADAARLTRQGVLAGFAKAAAEDDTPSLISDWVHEDKDARRKAEEDSKVETKVDPRALSEWQGPEAWFRSWP